jgi:hypothetical protein
VSNRRAQDERIEGTPDGANAITEIVDIPDAPTIGTATAGMVSASVTFTPATTGGTPTLYTATSTPGSVTGTSATSPITVSGLTAGISYTFKVKGSNSTGTGVESSASNSVTPTPPMEGAYDSLASVTVPSGGVSSINFAGIPSGYKHLQLRMFARSNRATDPEYFKINFNGDTNANYSWHYMSGQGASVVVSAGANATYVFSEYYGGAAQNANTFGAGITNILDYADVNKFKTIRDLGGYDNNGDGQISFQSGNWRNYAAISSIQIRPGGGSLIGQYSSFALYGVK